jgi:hypothetical protein
MPNKIQLPPAKSLEEMWAIIQETNEWRKETEKMMKESAAEADRQRKETERIMKENATEAGKRIKEIEQQLKEAGKIAKENGKLIKETSRQLGDVHNRLGDLVEHIILPNILKKVKPLGYGFKHVRTRYEFTDKSYRVIAEADILLINGEYLMIIEVKTVLRVKDVDNHLKRLERIRNAACPPADSHKFIGCVAGAVVDETVKKYAHKKGLYVLEQSGDTVKLDIPEDFDPKIW